MKKMNMEVDPGFIGGEFTNEEKELLFRIAEISYQWHIHIERYKSDTPGFLGKAPEKKKLVNAYDVKGLHDQMIEKLMPFPDPKQLVDRVCRQTGEVLVKTSQQGRERRREGEAEAEGDGSTGAEKTEIARAGDVQGGGDGRTVSRREPIRDTTSGLRTNTSLNS
jgi:hypothetical protein